MLKKILFNPARTLLVLTWVVLGFIVYTYFSPGYVRPQGAPTPAPTGAGWIDLLDAENAQHWKNLDGGKPVSVVENGELHIFGSMPPLKYATYTGQTFGDFDLHLEFKLSPPKYFGYLAMLALNPQMRTNSGVFLRVPKGDSPLRGFEVQVLDDALWPPNKNGTGSIYDVVSPMHNMARPAGEWNSYDIHTRGTRVVVVVNGWKVVDADFAQMTRPIGKFKTPYASLPKEGYISLQDHGGELWYRNIRVRPADPADPIPGPTPGAAPSAAVKTGPVTTTVEPALPVGTVEQAAPPENTPAVEEETPEVEDMPALEELPEAEPLPEDEPVM